MSQIDEFLSGKQPAAEPSSIDDFLRGTEQPKPAPPATPRPGGRTFIQSGAEQVVPGAIFNPGIDSDESVFGPETQAAKDREAQAQARAAAAHVPVPDATAASMARDTAASVLKIVPTAIKGVADISRMATGDRLGVDTSNAMEGANKFLSKNVGSDRAKAQATNFQQDMANDDVSLSDALVNNKGALLDQLLPSLGSMFLPFGVAAGVGKVATMGRAAIALDSAAIAARVTSAQNAAGIGTIAAQNAADTFTELMDKGASMGDAYLAAGITVPFSVIAGRLTGGGAEGALTRALTGSEAAKMGVKQVGRAMLHEGGQESGEELGQIVGPAVATGDLPSLPSVAKRLAVAGTLGSVMGGGVDVATQAHQHYKQKKGAQDASPDAQNPPSVDDGFTPMTRADFAVAINSRLADIERKENGTEDHSMIGPDGKPMTIAGQPSKLLTKSEMSERDALRLAAGQADGGLDALSAIYKIRLDDTQGQTSPVGAGGPLDAGQTQARIDELMAISAQRELTAQETQEGVALLAAKAQQANIGQGTAAAPATDAASIIPPTPATQVNAPSDFWSFAATKGFKPADIVIGTPEHAALKAEFDAAKAGQANQSGEAGSVLPPLNPQVNPDLQNRDRNRAASVVQMADIARNPDYMRLGPSRTPDSGSPMVFAVDDDVQANIAPDAFGKQDVAVMADGQRVPFTYAVVSADKVQPSNFADGRQNPEFASSQPGTLKALNNGRTAGIRAAHELGATAKYVQEMQDDEATHGIPADVIARVPNPMLVRVYSDSSNTAGMAAKSQAQGLGMSASETARQDAQLIDSSVISQHQGGDIASADNRDFVRAFVGKLMQAGHDIATLMTGDGQLSQDGRKRLQAALVQNAYGDSDMVEEMFDSVDTDIKAIGEALKAVAGQWANMRDSARAGVINPQVDINENLLQAIGLIRKARRDKTSLYDMVRQPDLMTGETPDAITVSMLRLFYDGQYFTRAIGKDRLAGYLENYLTTAMTTSPDAGIFGDVVSPMDILATINPLTTTSKGRGDEQTQSQEGGGQPAGSLNSGGNTGQGRAGQPKRDTETSGNGPAESGRTESGQDANTQGQQQDGQGDQGVAKPVGRMTEIAIPSQTIEWMGFDGGRAVRADLQALANRHSEYYDNPKDVQEDISFVLEKPDGWYIHKDARVILFRERVGTGAIPQARIEIEADTETMMVRSVYVGGKRQIVKKMSEKLTELRSLGLGGQSPESLTIAEYIEALSNGSSRPAAPSGTGPQAELSVSRPANEGNTPRPTTMQVYLGLQDAMNGSLKSGPVLDLLQKHGMVSMVGAKLTPQGRALLDKLNPPGYGQSLTTAQADEILQEAIAELKQPTKPPAPAVSETAPAAPADKKSLWLKAINDENRLTGDTGVQLAKAQEAYDDALLSSQSADDLKAKSEREAAAAEVDRKEQKRLSDKAKADAQVGDFTLSGSDRPADVAAAAGQEGLFDAPGQADADAKAQAQKDLDDALGDLASIMTKNFRKMMMPEQEQALLPVLTKVMDAAFRLGYYKFKDAAKFALDTIRAKLGAEGADMVTLDHLQGAYIGMAGKYQDKGASSKREVIDVESLAQLTIKAENPLNARPIQTKPIPARDSDKAQSNAAAGDRDSKPVGTGLAQTGEGTDRSKPVPRGTEQSGAGGKEGSNESGPAAPSAPRDSAGVWPEPGSADDHVIDAQDIGKGGLAKKYRDNIAAIHILKALQTEGRVATPDERKVLAKYVGWGAMKGPFDPANKQWAKQHEELKALLTPEEFRAARKSTLDAHYTSPVAVGAMFDAMQRLGFNGGRVLEPSVGSGNFFGLMPRDMRNASNLHGVELDALTSRLVAALYPNAKIAQATGFEDFDIPGEYFDLVIGNPPFGSQPLVDKDRSPYSGMSIHNYFLAKAIDKLRPGGIMQVIVSHSFLDAQDDRARKWIGERASLIGAVRLPNTAFKENAGTEVVTDILIFQKHDKNGLPSNTAPWQKVVEQVNLNPKTGESVKHKVNEFFVANPPMVLGAPSAGGSMYAANEYTVQGNGDLTEQLADWVKSLPKNIYSLIDRKADTAVVDMAIPDGLKVGSFYVDASGKVMQRGADVLGDKTANEWAPKNDSTKARMVGMIGLRDSLRSQMRLERSLDATELAIEANRAKLNRLYGDFLKKFGHLNNQVNRRIFFDDTESQLLQALEFDFDKGISAATAEKEDIEPRDASAVKADILKRRVAFPPQDFLTVNTAKDALLASLNYRGKVDGAYMAQVYGKPMDEIVKELGDLMYDDPQNGMVTADGYLSGDVKTKLAEAQAAALDDAKYKRNVDALERVIPIDKKPSEISVSIGAGFVPAELYQQFVKHISGGDATAIYVTSMGQWLMAYHGATSPALQTGKFGTSALNAQELFQMSMMGRGAVVKKTIQNGDGTTTTILLEKETEAARAKQDAIKAEWQAWLWGDAKRADDMAALYNEKMNRIVERKFDGQHLSFPGMNPALTMLEHQKNGVWRGLQSYQVLYDHVVGAGKTFAMATLAMEMRRLGIARKPLFAVPNHLTLQWRSEFTRLYPGSNILAATPEDFSADRRERMFSKIITGDWDAVVIGHSSLKKIGLPEETERSVLKEQIDEVAEAVEAMKRGRGDRNIIRDMEKIRANLEAKMKDKLAAIGKRSKVVTFDELGIDAMFIDEMHEFKNLAYNSTMDRNPGMGNPNGSGKAFDLFVKTRWMFDTFGDKTPYISATGTPVSNSLVEMFNMQRYMQYPALKAQGLHVFDAWAKQFGKVENVYEVAPSGSGYRQSTRFAKFNNLPGLMGLYNTFADTITLDDLRAQEEAQGKRFPVPKIVGGRPTIVVAQRSPAVAALMGIPKADTTESGDIVFKLELDGDIRITKQAQGGKFIAMVGDANVGLFETEQDARLKIVESALSPLITVSPESILGRFGNLRQLTRETKGKVNALSLTSEANKAGLDYRLIDPHAADFPGSKINLAVDNMLRVYHQWTKDKGAQLVFCDLSIPLSARASYTSKERRLYVRDDSGAIQIKRGTMHTVPGFEVLPFFIVQKGTKEAKTFQVYDAASGVLIGERATKADAKESAAALVGDQGRRQIWIDKREAAGEIGQEQIDDFNNDNAVETETSEAFTRADIAGVSGAAAFSVYDDIKAKLMAKGVPEREIAFIHDYSTPVAKDKLFKAVNAGDIRFLLGSTPKMGAGTNVQKRLVGLHHIDAPWRPSDLEQREGRIIRRDNELYERDPDGFEVFIGRYATAQTYDTRRWQILEHKARGIEQLRNFDGTINAIDDIDGEAANSADIKAAASGNPLILEETKLRNEVKRLERLQASHADEALELTRKAANQEQYAQKSGPEQIKRFDGLIETLGKNPVNKEGWANVTVDGKVYKDKEAAGNEIIKATSVVRAGMAEKTVVMYRGIEFKFTTYGTALSAESPTGAVGIWGPTDEFSGSGFITRMANYADRLAAAQADTQYKIEKASKDAVAMRAQATVPFSQANDLQSARDAHRKVQRTLLAKGPDVPERQKAAVEQGITNQRAKLESLGLGDAVREYFLGKDTVLSRSQGQPKARVTKPNLQAMVNRIKAKMPNMPLVHVLASPVEAPQGLQDYITKQDAWADVEGAMHEGEFYMFASNLASMARAEHVLAEHEVGHFGLRAILGADTNLVMNHIWANNSRVRKAAAELQKWGDLSNAEAVEEVIVDIPTADLVTLKGWRKIVLRMRDWLSANGFEALAENLNAWLEGNLDDQQRADMLVAEMVSGARDYVRGARKGRHQGRTTDYIGVTKLSSLIAQLKGKDAWMLGEARARGFKSVEDLAAKNAKLLGKLNSIWEKKTQGGALGATERVQKVNDGKYFYRDISIKKGDQPTSTGWKKTYTFFAGGRHVVESLKAATAKIDTILGLEDDGTNPDGGSPKLSRAQPSTSIAARASAAIEKPSGTAKPLDKLAQAVTRATGIERLTRAAYDSAGYLLDRFTPEQIKAGVVSDYGIPDPVIDRRTQLQGAQRVQLRMAGKLIDKLATLTREESRVAYEWMNMDGADPSAYVSMMQGLPEESVMVLQEVQQMIDKLSLDAVALGQLDPETYKRHAFAYLRRSYEKHVLEQPDAKAKRQKSISILGNQYRGRGLADAVPMGKIKANDWWGRKEREGAADSSLKGEKFIRLERRTMKESDVQVRVYKNGKIKAIVKTRDVMLNPKAAELFGKDVKPQDTRLREYVYWPAAEAIPAKYSEWDVEGEWEVRDIKGANAILGRDFTAAQREAMGEIDEARFAIATTLHGMIHDIEVGKYFDWLGQKYAKADGDTVDGEVVLASERMLDAFKPGTWVQVPDVKVPGTKVLKYGKLAGKYIPGPIWNEIRQVANGQFRPFGDTYAKILTLWKTAKTALSPAVHLNNVMANFVMADWHEVTAGHLAKALNILLSGSERQGGGLLGSAANLAARAGRMDSEVAQEILQRYRDSGGDIGSWATQEIAKDQLEPLLASLQAELQVTDGRSQQAQIGVMAALQHLLHLKLPQAWDAFKPSKPVKLVSREAKAMIDLYQAEDDIFRLAAWLRAKEGGAADLGAGHAARRSFMDYQINAPWVQAMRNSAFPFISFSYRALPMLLETMGKKPHKMLKLMGLLGAVNALGVLMAGGDGGDDDDKRVRKLLPPEKAGKIWGIVPKLIRMPWNDDNKSPVYLDIRRFIPMGDVVDTNQGQSAIPLAPGLMPGGPLVILSEVLLNKSSFTGKPITLETDTATERTQKVLDHLYKAAMPNLVGVPNTYATTAVLDAAKGKTDAFGREQSVAQAMASSFGVKLSSYPEDVLRRNQRFKLLTQMMEIEKVEAQNRRQYSIKKIDRAEFDKEAKYQADKKRELQKEFAEAQ